MPSSSAASVTKPATLERVVDPWWASELLRVRGDLVSFLQLRAGASGAVAQEIVDGLGAELVERFRDRQHYPAAWFEEPSPEPRVTAAYHELLRTIALRRSYDHLRAEYRRRRLQPVLEEHLRSDGRPSVEHQVDARKLLSILEAELAALPVEDRELLARGERRDREAPLSGSERARLHRLRRRIVSVVAKKVVAR